MEKYYVLLLGIGLLIFGFFIVKNHNLIQILQEEEKDFKWVNQLRMACSGVVSFIFGIFFVINEIFNFFQPKFFEDSYWLLFWVCVFISGVFVFLSKKE